MPNADQLVTSEPDIDNMPEPQPVKVPAPKAVKPAAPAAKPVPARKPTLVSQEPPPPRCTKPWPAPTFELEMPERASFGWARHKSIEMAGPLGWGYVSLLTMHAAQGMEMDNATPSPRPTLYTVLLAAPEIGKSTIMKRAYQALRKQTNLHKATPNSAQALAGDFPMYSDKAQEINNPLESRLLFLDEYKSLAQAMEFSGSQLPDALCELWYDDTTATSTKSVASWCQVRLSILGALPASNGDEFREYFKANTTKGLYSRLILAPGPDTWRWDFRQQIIEEYRPALTVTIPDIPYSLFEAWVDAKPGRSRRLGEIGLRVAKISASLNGDTEVSMECMKAALYFAEWQEKVREEYTPSQASDKATDSSVTEKILKAVEKEGYTKDGDRRLVKWTFLARKYHFDRLGAAIVKRVREAMIADGTIEGLMDGERDKSGNLVGKATWAGMVMPAQQD